MIRSAAALDARQLDTRQLDARRSRLAPARDWRPDARMNNARSPESRRMRGSKVSAASSQQPATAHTGGTPRPTLESGRSTQSGRRVGVQRGVMWRTPAQPRRLTLPGQQQQQRQPPQQLCAE